MADRLKYKALNALVLQEQFAEAFKEKTPSLRAKASVLWKTTFDHFHKKFFLEHYDQKVKKQLEEGDRFLAEQLQKDKEK